MANDIADLRSELSALRSEIKSLLATYNANNVGVQQSLTGAERWQEAHETLDNERWENVKEKLSELKGMLETIPVKIEDDLREIREANAKLGEQVNTHEKTIVFLRGAWVAMAAVVTLLGMYLKYKGG